MAAPARKRHRGSKYSDDPARELLEVIANGDAVVLNRVLQEMSSIERACVLKAATVNSHSLGCAGGDTALHYAANYPRRDFGLGVIQDMMFVFGGGGTSTIESYNSNSDEWRIVGSLATRWNTFRCVLCPLFTI